MPDKSELLQKLLTFLDDSQAIDVVAIDVSQQTSVTDFMIVASGRSSRQVKSIANNVMEGMKAIGITSLGAHGLEGGDWVLVDFGDFVLHVMQPDSRSFYNIEGLWQDNYEARS